MHENFHTHTYRCGHAEGNEKEYVARAVQAGLKTLGFSDHTPYDFFDLGSRNRPMRMKPEELEDYAESIRRLSDLNAARIQLRLGVEAEYYPRYFSRTLNLLRDNGIEYMILGQHFLGNEVDGPYTGRGTEEPAILSRYVSQTDEALRSGLFTYFAHPDLIHFCGECSVYEREIRKLCRTARETDTPLEINLLGIREGRHYPNEQFWRIAGEEGCVAILGCDAHRPEDTADPESEEKARALASRCGVPILDSPVLKPIF